MAQAPTPLMTCNYTKWELLKNHPRDERRTRIDGIRTRRERSFRRRRSEDRDISDGRTKCIKGLYHVSIHPIHRNWLEEHDGNDGFWGTESNINTNDRPLPAMNFGNRRANETQMCFINVPQMSLYFHQQQQQQQQQTIIPSVVASSSASSWFSSPSPWNCCLSLNMWHNLPRRSDNKLSY